MMSRSRKRREVVVVAEVDEKGRVIRFASSSKRREERARKEQERKRRLPDWHDLTQQVLDQHAARELSPFTLQKLLALLARMQEEEIERQRQQAADYPVMLVPVDIIDLIGRELADKRQWSRLQRQRKTDKAIKGHQAYLQKAAELRERHPDWKPHSVATELEKRPPALPPGAKKLKKRRILAII